MKLKDILCIINESTIVNVVDYNKNKVVSRYDGKNSIDSEFNNKNVLSQYVKNNELYIVVY